MTSRGPTTRTLDERIDDLALDMSELSKGMTDLRTDLAKFQGGVEKDLKWIKGIGASVLVAVVTGAVWVIRDNATLSAEVRHQGNPLEKVEKRLDTFAENNATLTAEVRHQGSRLEKVEKGLNALGEKIDAKLDALLRRGEPKP